MTTQTAPGHTADELRQRWEAYKQSNQRPFMYDAARAFGVSEAQILASGCGAHVTRLEAAWPLLLGALERCPEVMALTRNRWAVIEKKGPFTPLSINGAHGLVLGAEIDLRMFITRWKYAYAVHMPDSKAYAGSVQFYCASGESALKVFVPRAHAECLEGITRDFAAADQSPEQQIEAASPVAETEQPVDAAALLADWGAMKDTHDFYGMLKKHRATRTQALRLAEGAFTRPLSPTVYQQIFKQAAESELAVMVFVGNAGCIEIHTGPVRKIVPMEGWFNIMDPGFNLHLLEAGVAAAWHVRKPTVDGDVNSVELYDADGNEIALIFGKRKPGIPELSEWRDLANSLA